jgi:competence protein ComEA
MAAGRFINGWTVLIILLVVIIAAGSVVAWSRYSPSQTIEISTVPEQKLQGEVYVGGEVNNPGFYPLEAGDSLGDIIQAAGGTNGNADLNCFELLVPALAEEEPGQKVNINRAEAWLLQALPGIGEGRAEAIINYRQQNGPFHNTDELLKVEGIGMSTYEQIKDLVTVAEY